MLSEVPSFQTFNGNENWLENSESPRKTSARETTFGSIYQEVWEIDHIELTVHESNNLLTIATVKHKDKTSHLAHLIPARDTD